MSRAWANFCKGLSLLALVALAGCGKPAPSARFQRPDQVTDFAKLYGMHCAGCHGAEGIQGPAPPLNDSLFRAIVPVAELERVITHGRPGTLMTAFGQQGGGPLTPAQVQILVNQIKGIPYRIVEKTTDNGTTFEVVAGEQGEELAWKQPAPPPGPLPEYLIDAAAKNGKPGDVEAGAQVFAMTCANCHGENGQGSKEAGAVNNPAFLALISDQALRRLIITGRPDLKGRSGDPMPDYRHQYGGPDVMPLSSQDIADLTALLASWRSSSIATFR